VATTKRALCVLLALWLLGCEREDSCYGRYFSCIDDEDCAPGNLPPGKCLDDRETGRICALYFYNCPTMLQWDECAGAGDRKSSWAGRCVRPEFLPDAGGAPAPPDAGTDMSAAFDASAPS